MNNNDRKIYAKDWKTVYYDGKEVKDAEAKSFKIIGYGYAKDWKCVYYNGEMMKDAEVQSFQIIEKKKK